MTTRPRLPLFLMAIAVAALAITPIASAGGGKPKAYPTKVRLSDKFPAFHGKVKSKADACISDRKIRLFKVKRGDDRVIGKTRTDMNGKWEIIKMERPGAYYAKANKGGSAALNIVCKSAVSEPVAID